MNDNYILIYRYTFDNSIIKRIKLNSSGKWDEKITQRNVDKEQETKETPIKFKSITIINYQDKSSCYKDKYDAFGRVVMMKYYENNILTGYTEFKYNSPYTKTKCDQFKMFETPRKLKCIRKFNYNPEGNKIQDFCFYPNGDLAWYTDYIYKKQLTEILTYNNENVLIYKRIIFFDSKGVIVKKEKLVHKDLIQQWKIDSEEIGFYLWTTGA
ncbi:MAG: hypothetical protein NTZ33_04945 [Bacteroidetes bacterium]|nr:hypothetical protein [Bacteroidota bacterium]